MNDEFIRPPGHVIVIGSGVGGMTAAVLLARLGHRVTVVEKNKFPGGLMRSYVREGIECEVGIHYIGAMDTGQPLRLIFDALGITGRVPVVRMGEGGIIDRYILPGMVFDFPPGIDAFEENLRRAFPDEGRQISGITALIREASERLCSLSMVFREGTEFDMARELRSTEEYFEELGCSQGLRSILVVPGAWLGLRPVECPRYLWSATISSFLMSSWRLARGGAHLADVFAERLKELGGEYIGGDSVVRILVCDRAVRGVVLTSGRELASSAVIAAIHPKALLRLLPEDSYRPSYKSKIESLQETPGMFGVHITVPEGEIHYRPHNIFVLDADRDRPGGVTFFHMKKSPRPGWNTVSILEESPYERWRTWENTTTEHRPPDYQEAKDREIDALLGKALKTLGPMPGAHVVDSFTPLSFRDWVDSPEGGAYGVRRSVGQKFKTAALHRTTVAGLHVVGQSVFAPGILGTALGTLKVLAPLVGHDTLQRVFVDSGDK